MSPRPYADRPSRDRGTKGPAPARQHIGSAAGASMRPESPGPPKDGSVPLHDSRRLAFGTGLAVASRAGVPVIIGEANCYHWWRRIIMLRASVAAGTGAFQQLCAAHEAAHHAQNVAMPWLRWMRWFEPIRWWSELDAWRRAIESLA